MDSSTTASEKRAATDHPVLEPIRERWSPRAFADTPVEREKLLSLFEAARWAASSFNEQPWRFIVATRDEGEAYDKVLSCLVPFNQSWAKTAPVLMLALTRTAFTKNESHNRVHQHDLGLAMGNLSIQATALGLHLHQMAGIEPDKVRETFDVPEGFEPQTGCAIGYVGDPAALPDDLRKQEAGGRERMKLSEFIFTHRFGEASPLVK